MAHSDDSAVDQEARPVFRLLRPFWWAAHAFTGYKIVASLLAGLFFYGQVCGGPNIDDINNVRNLASYLSLSGDPIPLAADGRIDVYIFVRKGEIEGEDDLQVYVSALTGQGPTLEEMLAGDYTNFPYERYRGEVSPKEPGVPLLWERQQPLGSGRRREGSPRSTRRGRGPLPGPGWGRGRRCCDATYPFNSSLSSVKRVKSCSV